MESCHGFQVYEAGGLLTLERFYKCTCERGHRADPAVVGMNSSETVGHVLIVLWMVMVLYGPPSPQIHFI